MSQQIEKIVNEYEDGKKLSNLEFLIYYSHRFGNLGTGAFVAEPAAAELAELREQLAEARATLNQIAGIAGNLPDERFTSKTGANDAQYRGGLLVAARHYAQAWLELYPEAKQE